MGPALCPEVSNTTTDLRTLPSNAKLSRNDRSPKRTTQKPLNPATKEDFNFIKVVGVGSYGKVFLVQHKTTKKHFAMKVIKKEVIYRTMQDQGIKGKYNQSTSCN